MFGDQFLNHSINDNFLKHRDERRNTQTKIEQYYDI